MIFNPDVLTLLFTSLLVLFFAILSSISAVEIIMKWDLTDGSERQIKLERRTYLVSMIMSYLLFFEILSLFLFVFCAERLHGLLIGAMCAAGSLNANDFGYPALILKMVNAILCGIWILVNRLDNQGHDYPLISKKYKMLIPITAMLSLEAYLVWGYFLGVRANVITSCCGSLFSSYAEGLTADLASISSYTAKILFFLVGAVTVRLGFHLLFKNNGARLFALSSGSFFTVSLIAMVSFISLYYYELPTHHCPFCLLQAEYGYIGYFLYAFLLGGTIMGIGVGALEMGRGKSSIASVTIGQQRAYCAASVICYLAFMATAAYPMIFSDFKLEGY